MRSGINTIMIMEINVIKTDGSECRVTIAKLGINNLPKLLDDKHSLESKANLFLEGANLRVDELMPDSQMDVYDAGMEVNEPNMLKYMERQKKQVKLMTGMDMGELLRGKVSAPTSPDADTV